MSERYDAIVIGAGHNGLVCASLLGKAGKKVLVLEANDQVGGAAVTREFAEGYSASACAHLLYQLQPQVEKDLGLKIRLAADDIGTLSLGTGGEHVRINGDTVSGVSEDDVMEIALEFGAEDVVTDDEGRIEVVTAPEDYLAVKDALQGGGLEPGESEVAMVPQSYSDLDADAGEKVLRLLDALEDLDDVTSVYTNASFPEELLS